MIAAMSNSQSHGDNDKLSKRQLEILETAYNEARGNITARIPYSTIGKKIQQYKSEDIKNDTYYLEKKGFLKIASDMPDTVTNIGRTPIDIQITVNTADCINTKK